MKILLILPLFLLFIFNSFAQSDSTCILKGKLTFKDSGEPVYFGKIMFYQDSVMKAGAQSDFDGLYQANYLPIGVYTVKISSLDIKDKQFENVSILVKSNEVLEMNFELEPNSVELQEIHIVTLRREDVASMPARMTTPVATMDGMKIRGSRTRNADKTSRESYNRIVENEFQTAKRTPLSTFSIDVDKAAYSNVRRFINDNQKPPIDAVRIEEMINYFTYAYPQPGAERPFSVTTAYSDCPWNTDHKLAFIGLQGKKIEIDQTVPNNLVFLIDVSGSMRSANKLDLLKSGLNLLIDQLRPEDQVSIVVYAGSAGLVLPVTKGDMKDKIKDALQKLTAGGSTAGGEGIELAYKLAKENFIENGNNRVILASDGDFNVGVSNQSELIKLIEQKRGDNVYLSVLGFGSGNLQDGTMEQLADKGNGNYSYIDNLKEAKKILVDEMGGTLITIAKDVKIQVEFNPKSVKGYRLIGYENRALNDEDFNNDKVDAGDMGAGHSVTAIYEIIPSNSADTLSNIDPLIYQKSTKQKRGKSAQNELLTIKIRYKNPSGLKSNLSKHIIYNNPQKFDAISSEFQFAGSVAAFGKMLRDSKFQGDMDIDKILELAEGSLGEDKAGYRKGFIMLINKSKTLSL